MGTAVISIATNDRVVVYIIGSFVEWGEIARLRFVVGDKTLTDVLRDIRTFCEERNVVEYRFTSEFAHKYF